MKQERKRNRSAAERQKQKEKRETPALRRTDTEKRGRPVKAVSTFNEEDDERDGDQTFGRRHKITGVTDKAIVT